MTAFPHIEGMASCIGFVLEEIKEHLLTILHEHLSGLSVVSLAYAMTTRNNSMKDE